MNAAGILNQLAITHELLSALAGSVDDSDCRAQYHPDLSPLGWHLGHCVYIECFWLHEQVRGDDTVTAPLARLYTPPHTPKPERGKLLPPQSQLLQWAHELHAFNRSYLANLPAELADHELFQDDYLQGFLLQHHSQHYETMLMVLTQRALADATDDFPVQTPLQARQPVRDTRQVPAGHYRVGGRRPEAFDNELPVQRAELGRFDIAAHPVTNAEYLAFMEAGGYQDARWWSPAGWAWREATDATHPDHWRRNGRGEWFGIAARGPYELAADEPVLGISHHEASAYAAWAGGQLPHEYQWEAACRLGVLEQTGRAWEWCANTFHPYEGFESFPYREYSTPWLGGDHYTLKGGSLHTRPAVKRASFRNFYEPDKRHIFAGLRLVY